MLHVAISQITTTRWELPEELAQLVDHGFDCLSLWRPKLSDIGSETAASLLAGAGVRVSSLQWVSGFTGGDGRTFAESIDDAVEAIEAAAAVSAPVLVVHSGCRGGHTRSHARRLLVAALERLAPIARESGVTLALKPLHPAVAADSSFITSLEDALGIVDHLGHPAIRLAIDLWQFGDDKALVELLPRLAEAAAVVQVADRDGPASADMERLPPGQGELPLEALALALIGHGYGGDFEFDPIGEAVAALGYRRQLADTRRLADAWAMAAAQQLDWTSAASADHRAAGQSAEPSGSLVEPRLRGGFQFRSAGSRRSHASSQTVSRG